MRLAAAILAAVALTGCLNWQAGYDNLARSDCREVFDGEARRECLARVEQQASEKRAGARN